MVTTVQKWGNSQGIRLSKDVLSSLHLAVGDAVEVSVADGLLTVTPVRSVRGRYNIDDLMALVPDDYEPEEPAWGPPVGREVW